MNIEDAAWETLTPEVSIGVITAPTAVYRAIGALVEDPTKIAASWATYDGGSPTLWQVWFVTEATRALGCVEVEFKAAAYALNDEQQQGRTPADYEIKQAWIRSLTRVTKLDVGLVGGAGRSGKYTVDGVRLTFDNGDVVELPSLTAASPQPHADARAEHLLSTVRAAIPF